MFPSQGTGRFPFYSLILRGPQHFHMLKMSNSRFKKKMMICMYIDPAYWVNAFERGTF